ncbi:TPA: shikimate kinase, partial [Morganella morganii]
MNHQDEKPIIYLIGARGAGKTTVGKPLAQALLYDFIDTDACVTEQCRMSISQLVEQSGWRSFRELESDVLRQVSKPHRLVSTGGGIVMAPENRA